MLLTTAVRCVHCIVIPPPPFSPVSRTLAFSAPLRSHVPGARVVPCPGAVNPCQACFLAGACAGLRRMMGRAHDGPGQGSVLKVGKAEWHYWSECVLKIIRCFSPSASPSVGSLRAAVASHSSAPGAHHPCSSGAAAPSISTCVLQSSTRVGRQTPG